MALSWAVLGPSWPHVEDDDDDDDDDDVDPGETCDTDATFGRYRNASAAFRIWTGPVGIDDDEEDDDEVDIVASSSSSLPSSFSIV